MARLKIFIEHFKIFFERWWMVGVLLAVLPFFFNAALANERSVNYVNNDFFTFWLSGHMHWAGGQPYSSADWLAGHRANGASWMPNQIFPYPLPLALITAPLGLLPIQQAYIVWGILSQILVTLTILALSAFWQGLNRRFFAVFILVAVIVNSNIHLMLQTGTIGSLFLLFLLAALVCKQKNWDFLAGVALALMALKPSLLTIVALIGLWLLLRRNWKMIAGGLCGGLALLGIGMAQDIHWVDKFREASANLFNLRLGNQPTIISYTRLACAGDLTCAFWLYGLIALILVGLYTWLLWKRRATLTPLFVFSAAIALGVLLPPYIWSYDYVLLVIPICLICFELLQHKGGYLYALLFLLVLDCLSLWGAFQFATHPESSALTIQRDMWSIWVALLVLALGWWVVFRKQTDARP